MSLPWAPGWPIKKKKNICEIMFIISVCDACDRVIYDYCNKANGKNEPIKNYSRNIHSEKWIFAKVVQIKKRMACIIVHSGENGMGIRVKIIRFYNIFRDEQRGYCFLFCRETFE